MTSDISRRIAAGMAFVALTATGPNALAQQAGDFQVPKHGALRLSIPDDWAGQSRPVDKPPAVAVHIKPKSGEAFDVQITAVWQDAKALKTTTSDSIRSNAEEAGKHSLDQAVEKTVTLKEIKGSQVVGWYYMLTDKNPAPGEFKYMTQGVFLTGELLCVFTILHRNEDTPEVAQAIKAFGESVHRQLGA